MKLHNSVTEKHPPSHCGAFFTRWQRGTLKRPCQHEDAIHMLVVESDFFCLFVSRKDFVLFCRASKTKKYYRRANFSFNFVLKYIHFSLHFFANFAFSHAVEPHHLLLWASTNTRYRYRTATGFILKIWKLMTHWRILVCVRQKVVCSQFLVLVLNENVQIKGSERYRFSVSVVNTLTGIGLIKKVVSNIPYYYFKKENFNTKIVLLPPRLIFVKTLTVILSHLSASSRKRIPPVTMKTFGCRSLLRSVEAIEKIGRYKAPCFIFSLETWIPNKFSATAGVWACPRLLLIPQGPSAGISAYSFNPLTFWATVPGGLGCQNMNYRGWHNTNVL